MFDRIVLQEKAEQAEEMKANALEKEALEEQNASVKIAGDRAELLDSKLPEPRGSKIGPTDPDAEITVTIMVKSVASEQEVNRTLEDIASGKRKPLSDAEFNASFGADPMAMSKVLRFAASSGLSVEKCDMNASQIQLKGKVRDFSKAFNVEMEDYQDGPVVNRTRRGNISVPSDLADDVHAVFGLDNCKIAEAHVQKSVPGQISPDSGDDFLPCDVADLYNSPQESVGARRSVRIVVAGDKLDVNDNKNYVYSVGVGEGESTIGRTSAASAPYEAVIIRANGALGHAVGYPNPFLYKNGNEGVFNDITAGSSNGYYYALEGWDAVTGLRTLDGSGFYNQLRS